MKNFLSCAAMLAMILLAWSADGATPVQKKSPVKKGSKTSTTTKKKTTTARKSPVTGKSTTIPASKLKNPKKAPAKRATATTWRNRQMTPSSDRYREIQQALASKGYLQPEDATGTWNTTSADAMKKFQAEQNLDANGKINSLSLIALGLGPKRETPVVPAPPNH